MKILQIFGEPLSNGGQESFIMNMYRNIDRNKVQFDFFTPYYCDNENIKKEIETLGGSVFCGGGSFEQKGRKKDFIKKLKDFLKINKYEVVHIHSGSIFALAFGAKIAKKNGVKKIIVHSHASGVNSLKYKIIKTISKPIFLKNATNYCACSKLAAEWKFPKKIINEKKYKIIKNGIDLEKFNFKDEIRKEYRRKLNLDDKYVLCHVGRFAESKNHEFLIKVFEKIKSEYENTLLLLIGEGQDKEKIEKLVKNLKLEEDVKFLGIRNDVSEILQASDCFIFPSLSEGLGIVAIEAQATGLPTICSENVPDEANVSRCFHKLSLNQGTDKWAEEILKYKKHERKSQTEEIQKKGYDAKESANMMLALYEQNKEVK